MITTDAYGMVPRSTFQLLAAANVTPSEWDDILDAYEDITSGEPDFPQVERWVRANTVDGAYQPRWPLDRHAITTA